LSPSRGRILVYRPGAVGDALLARPALRAVRLRYPSHCILLATHPAVLPLLAADCVVDDPISQDSTELLWLFGAGSRLPRPPDLDLAVLWTSAPEQLALDSLRGARLVQAPSRPPPDSGRHVARFLLDSLAELGIEPDGLLSLPPVPVPTAAHAQAGLWLDRHGARDEQLVALHPGSGSAAKNWPLERFLELGWRLEARGLRILLVLGPADEAIASRVTREHTARHWLRAEGLDLAVLAALLLRCRAFVGNDSGISHLAGQLGIATVALFGASDPRTWAPLGPRVSVVEDPGWRQVTPRVVLEALNSRLRTD
jgi:heptosyltransferase-3